MSTHAPANTLSVSKSIDASDNGAAHLPSELDSKWRPTASLERLRQRAELLSRLRAFFAQQGLWEVETPVLSTDTVVDRYLDPVPVQPPCASERENFWLQTSPEFGMKRLLAAGAEMIYQVTRAFRQDEAGPLHNPEFTMVEWYCVGDSLERGMQRLADLCVAVLDCQAPTRLTYRDAFLQTLALDPHTASLAELKRCAASANLQVSDSFLSADHDEWLNLLLAERVQPRLGVTAPVIVCDYPASQAALAQIRHDERGTRVASRFELYAQGIELANGYHELLDAAQLQLRQTQANALRQSDGKARLPEDNRLIQAMQHGLPDCCGVALGFDRLAMIALGAQQLSDVLAFPIDRA